jgi:hypothetical protein
LLVVVVAASTLLALVAPAEARDGVGRLDPALVALWNRTDAAVANGTANRSWM